MDALLLLLPWLLAMAVLVALSAFFSAAEAALFYLRPADLRHMETGTPSQRIAVGLLTDPDRLLTAILFCNLMVNVAYFAIASIAGLELSRDERYGNTGSLIFAGSSLLMVILFGEMLPKSLGVLSPKKLAPIVSIPLALCVRVVGPLMPLIRTVNLLSLRLLWPSFEPEPYLEINDLARAIELSTSDATLLEQEQSVLQRIVQLSEVRVDELMRPRPQIVTFKPPVTVNDLRKKMPPSGYLLVTEPESDDVVSAVHLWELVDIPNHNLEAQTEPVIYVPWCITAAEALQQMEDRDRDVAAVVNEFGETIGVLTYEDILDTLFTSRPSRSDRLLHRPGITEVRPGVWHVTSLTSLRRLARHFQLDVDHLPETRSVTVAGIVQEALQKVPEPGDEGAWGPFHFRVLESPFRARMLIEFVRREASEAAT